SSYTCVSIHLSVAEVLTCCSVAPCQITLRTINVFLSSSKSKHSHALCVCILLAMTSIGPAFGFITGALMLRFYVDFDKVPKEEIELDTTDLRWVGAWWLGFLVASCILFLTALPYLFFPRNMPKEVSQSRLIQKKDVDPEPESKEQQTDTRQEPTLIQFLKSFPKIALRTLRNPIYLLVVLALVNLSALLSGLATFMAKFIEKQFSQSASFSTMMIGGVGIPMAVLGTVLGGALMRRFSLSVNGASKLCTIAILLCILTALPMLFLGCPTQSIAGVSNNRYLSLYHCSSSCHCSEEAFNPVCGSDGVEFRSPCHAGCQSVETDNFSKVNYTECRCVSGLSFALPGSCGSGCEHLLIPFVVLLGLTAFIAAFSQTPSCMMILREVPPEDKSFAVGVQYMLFRVLAFMPGPVLYGSVIDTTCILWGKKCGKETSCQYYNLESFRSRFLGLQVVFVCGGLLCYLLTIVVLRKRDRYQESDYQMVNQKISEKGKEKELIT
uniref:Solute carrier organic anion transporter family member n=1 Tax=Neolamprologus brichardi TaxID=32507 RepID=A0A3Q4MX89_NEOBR